MKKIILPAAVAIVSMLAASCSMDHPPVGSLLEDEAIESTTDCFNFRNGFYNNIRAGSTGGFVALSELQMDQFIGTIINGNRQGAINNGDIQSNNDDIESIWSGFYGAIANVNFFLPKAEALLATDLDESDALQLKRYIAEAYFFRAFFYYWLLDHYCPKYSDDSPYGLPIVADYGPTHIKDGYPSRSTQAQTYAFIEGDLDKALAGLEEYEAVDPSNLVPMAIYLNSQCVHALKARLALLKGDLPTAKTEAETVLTSGYYTLATLANFKSMWTNDNNPEIIFQPSSVANMLGISSTGGYWIGSSETQADYIPVPTACITGLDNLYESPRDRRVNAYFGKRNLMVEGSRVECPVFVKYPGNPALMQTSTPNIMNMPKVFRLSEMLLIAAEASIPVDETAANAYLNQLRTNRISGYTAETYSGAQLTQEVRKERLRELIGEGFRMSDLRRWGEGFNRLVDGYTTYPDAINAITVGGNGVVYQPNDYRFTWPIPSSEMQVNPHMAGQQNPGYN